MSEIRVLIVDDEPLARRGIRQLLDGEPDFVVAGEASNGRAAAQAITRLVPDVVFLDIQMPLVDGFSLVETLGEISTPQIVFVTAYDQHALRAFDAGAVDYLLKPIDPERFQKTLGRVRANLGEDLAREADLRSSVLLRELELAGAKPEYLERIAVKEKGRTLFIYVNEVDWFTSEGNYVQLHTKSKTHLLRATMDGIEQKLDPRQFARLRRSTIVRIDQIQRIQQLVNGESIVILKDKTRLSSSRRYRHNLNSLIRT